MELKYKRTSSGNNTTGSSNRTFMELKYINTRLSGDLSMF